jgi:hypothetical protein
MYLIPLFNNNDGTTGLDGVTSFPSCSGGIWTGVVYSHVNSYYTDIYDANGRKQVMVHEVGHALGRNHAGGTACSSQPIMYTNSNRYFVCQHVNPQADDIERYQLHLLAIWRQFMQSNIRLQRLLPPSQRSPLLHAVLRWSTVQRGQTQQPPALLKSPECGKDLLRAVAASTVMPMWLPSSESMDRHTPAPTSQMCPLSTFPWWLSVYEGRRRSR